LVKNKYFYVYRIDFSDGYFYIGSRVSKVKPELDLKYMGSPKTHKNKWDDVRVIKCKSILKVFPSWEGAKEYEDILIREGWSNNLNFSLNESAGCGIRSLEKCSEIGKKISKYIMENKLGIFGMSLEQKQIIGRKTGNYLKDNNLGIFGLAEDQVKLNCQKGGLVGGQTTKKKYSKTVKFTDKDGNVFIHTGIKEFCRINNLYYANMKGVLNGKKNSYKGWKAEYIN